MKHVFISYTWDDQTQVDALCDTLRSKGIKTWLDRNNILPGQRWRTAIRGAIKDGAYFIACFSSNYSARYKTYMNEELTLAIEELRQRPTDTSWFIPVRLEECIIPDREIGGGETLRDLQWVDLFPDWNEGVKKLLMVIKQKYPKSSTLQAQKVRWGPNDGFPAGITINGRDGLFMPWNKLKKEIEQRLLIQLGRFIPPECKVVVKDYFGRKDWVVLIEDLQGKQIGHIWFGSNPDKDWVYDGLVRVGYVITDEKAKVLQTFQRFSDGSYRRVINKI